jgi:predicted nucleic acid-binding protein
MILLDTNVVSAMMRSAPDQTVAAWLDRQFHDSIWISTITVMEIRSGLISMPAGRRRDLFTFAFATLLQEKIQGRIASFDFAAAEEAAELLALRRRKGKPVEDRDTMIAGIAQARRAALATRNVAYFRDLSVPVINPWDPGGH